MPNLIKIKTLEKEVDTLQNNLNFKSQELEKLLSRCKRFEGHEGQSTFLCTQNAFLACKDSSSKTRRLDMRRSPSRTASNFANSLQRMVAGLTDFEMQETRPDADGVQDTQYLKSLRHYLTKDALPRESYYRNLESVADGRPTLDELNNQSYDRRESRDQRNSVVPDGTSKGQRGKVIKFGWVEGVLIPCLLNIWGVMLFLRISWVVGEAGIIFGVLVIILAKTITMTTSISMSAVASNGMIAGGGIYYMISRSLGPEFGAAIGLLFTVANSISAATNIIGFTNSFQDMFKFYFNVTEIIPGAGGGTNDVRIIGTVTMIILLIITVVGMDWVNRVQKVFLVILIVSQFNFVIGAFMGPQSLEEEAQGFVGFNGELFMENVKSNYRFFEGQHSFFTVFGVFFPGVTGIVAGANLSGDLKDPSQAIPKGTILAVFVTFLTYVLYPILVGAAATRDATGNITQLLMYKNSNLSVLDNPVYNASSCGFYETGQSMCNFGTQNNFQVIELMSAWGPLIYIGCFAATLSSAIATLVGAPRVLQALAKDRLYPYIHFFEVGFGANNDPLRGYILVGLISFACIMLGQLNAVSSLLTNCFLASYSFINFSVFHASLIKTPGWRPAFKYYNMWVSLAGGFICLIVMFLIDWIMALITFVIALTLYKYVCYRQPDVNWGSSTQAQIYTSALKSTLDLVSVEDHIKNYRPQILLFSGSPGHRPPLVDFAYSICKNVSLLTCANIVQKQPHRRHRDIRIAQAYKWLLKHKIRAFYSQMEADNMQDGADSLLQLVGLGKLRPNMVLMGYKNNWKECDKEEVKAYCKMISMAFYMNFATAILRVRAGLDYSTILDGESLGMTSTKMNTMPSTLSLASGHQNGYSTTATVEDSGTEGDLSSIPGTPAVERSKKKARAEDKKTSKLSKVFRGVGDVVLPKLILNNITMFRKKQKGTIDVWWLFDDGGLTLLLPYILTTRSHWSGCKLRVFTLASRQNDLEAEQRSMASLLTKFRIDFNDMIIIPNMAQRAKESSKMEFEELIKDFKINRNSTLDKADDGLLISDAEILAQREKTNRYIRLRELLLENSLNSSLVVMTLPIPRSSVSAFLYMAWLETLTKGMPPFLLVRGNQTSVLTFYS